MQIEILYTDDAIVVINKPSGLNVHEAPGPGSSVVRELARKTGFEGLTPVHRLDKDASGVLVLGRSKSAVKELGRLWETVVKTYWVLCEGVPKAEHGIIDAPILEHQTGKPERLRNAVRYFVEKNPSTRLPPLPEPKTSAVHPAGRSSQTEFRILERHSTGARTWSWLEVRPKQGRMHQIRVHMAHNGHPLAVDSLYGVRKMLTQADMGGEGREPILTRMPLHAASLIFPDITHKHKQITAEAPLPDDINNVLTLLRV